MYHARAFLLGNFSSFSGVMFQAGLRSFPVPTEVLLFLVLYLLVLQLLFLVSCSLVPLFCLVSFQVLVIFLFFSPFGLMLFLSHAFPFRSLYV